MSEGLEEYTVSPEEEAALEAELRELSGERGEEDLPQATLPILQPWPMEPPSSIPSISVLKWSAGELHFPATTNPEASGRLKMVRARIQDLEHKMSSGVLSLERYNKALEAMLQKLQRTVRSEPSPTHIADNWVKLIQKELLEVSSQGKTPPAVSKEPEIPEGLGDEAGIDSMSDLEAEV